MGKFATTWGLMKDAWGMLMRDKALMLFPVVSSIACMLVLVTFIVPFLGVGFAKLRGSGETLTYVVLFLYYVANFFVVYFFNAALVDFVITRARGGEPTVGGSLRAAAGCVPQILAWALISSTVGVVLKILSSRAGFIGQIVIGIIGIAWALVTYFVVPIIVIERKGALESVSDSKELLAKTWGQQIISGVGYGLIGFLLTLPGIVILVVAVIGALATHGSASFALVASLAVVYLVGTSIVLATLQAIFEAVLYLFARTGKVPAGFHEDELRNAIRAT